MQGAGTQTTAARGHCPGVDLQQEAFLLAQQAEQVRKAQPFNGNYGNAWFEVCFTDGKTVADGVRPIRGFDTGKDPATSFRTHSEQAVYRFLQPKIAAFAPQAEHIVAIDVIIFSQVKVCPPCAQSMVGWQSELRQKAGTPNVFLSVWDLDDNGFAPTVFPAGTGTPVALADLRQVPIVFTP